MAAKKAASGKKLTAAQRKAIPQSEFAVPSKAGSAKAKAKSGNYPIEDRSHAQNALARSSGKPVAGQVRAAVAKKYPDMVQKKTAAKKAAPKKGGK